MAPVSRRSRKILLKIGLMIPNREEMVVVITTKATAAAVPRIRSFA